MTKYSFLGLAAIFLAAGNAAKAYAEGNEAPANDNTPASTGDGGEEAPKRRGRPPGKPAEEKQPETPAQDDAARFQANRDLIKPLVDAGQGQDVKNVIAKYSKTGLKDIPAASQADFEKDIAALAY